MALLKKLYHLIHAMDSAEKRHFRLYQSAMAKPDGQLNQLYDLLQRASPDQFGSKAFQVRIGSLNKNLPTLTRRLMDALQTALELQHRGKTMESRLNHALETIAMLYQKKQWSLATWKLKKEKKNALQFACFLQFISLLKWERKILLERFPNKSIDQLETIRQEEKQALHKLEQHAELSHLDDLVRHLNRQRPQSGDTFASKSLMEIAKNPAVTAGLKADDFLAFTYASNIKGICLNAQHDFQAAIEVYRPAYTNWKNNLGWIREQPQLFLALFSNYQIALLHGQDDVNELEECLLFIRQVQLADPTTRLIFQNLSYQGSIMQYMNRGKFEAAVALSEEIATWLQQNEKNLSSSIHLTFHYNAATIFFIMEDFSQMNRRLLKIMDFSGKTAREDITEMARIFKVIASLELGDVEYSDDLVRSAYQYYLRNQYAFHQRLTVELFRSLLRPTQGKSKRELFAKYLADLDQYVKETGKPPFGMMELRIWATARMREIPLRMVFEELISE